MAGRADVPPKSLPRYHIAFYVDLGPSRGLERAYAIDYCSDPATGAAFVYLPSRGDPRSLRNLILRDGMDGTWQRATPAFRNAVDAAIAR